MLRGYFAHNHRILFLRVRLYEEFTDDDLVCGSPPEYLQKDSTGILAAPSVRRFPLRELDELRIGDHIITDSEDRCSIEVVHWL